MPHEALPDTIFESTAEAPAVLVESLLPVASGEQGPIAASSNPFCLPEKVTKVCGEGFEAGDDEQGGAPNTMHVEKYRDNFKDHTLMHESLEDGPRKPMKAGGMNDSPFVGTPEVEESIVTSSEDEPPLAERGGREKGDSAVAHSPIGSMSYAEGAVGAQDDEQFARWLAEDEEDFATRDGDGLRAAIASSLQDVAEDDLLGLPAEAAFFRARARLASNYLNLLRTARSTSSNGACTSLLSSDARAGADAA